MVVSRHLILALLISTSTELLASEQEFQLQQNYSSLDSGLADWSDLELLWQQTDTQGPRFYFSYHDALHFGLRDQQYRFGKYLQASEHNRMQLELTASSERLLFPAYGLFAGIESTVYKPLVITAGLRYSHLDKTDPLSTLRSQADSLLLNTRLDYYSGNQLYSYTLYYTGIKGPGLSDTAFSQSIKFAHIYNDRNNVSISIATGSELDFAPTGASIERSNVQSLSIGGMHWLSGSLAVAYSLGEYEVSSSNFGYRRNEFHIGLRKLN